MSNSRMTIWTRRFPPFLSAQPLQNLIEVRKSATRFARGDSNLDTFIWNQIALKVAPAIVTVADLRAPKQSVEDALRSKECARSRSPQVKESPARVANSIYWIALLPLLASPLLAPSIGSWNHAR